MSELSFTEIPPHVHPVGDSYPFEVFALRFLTRLGYRIVVGPTMGPDRGQDGIVEREENYGKSQETKRYLVSCKHNAHGAKGKGQAVRDHDELNVFDRVEQHECDGFIGFYSTEITAALEDRLRKLAERGRCLIELYTPIRINEIAFDRFSEFQDLLALYFPESVSRYERSIYAKQPAGADDVRFKQDNPDIDIRTSVHEDGVVAMIGLVEGSSEFDLSFMSLTIQSEEELARFAEAIGSGKAVEVPSTRLSLDPETTLGRYLNTIISHPGALYLTALPERRTFKASLRVRMLGSKKPGGPVIRDREMELIQKPNGSVELKTTGPHLEHGFFLSYTSTLQGEEQHVSHTLNLFIGNESPRDAITILETAEACRTGAQITIYDQTSREQVVRMKIRSDESRRVDPALMKALRDLVKIEESLGISFVIPENATDIGDPELIERASELVTNGRASFPVVEGRVSIQTPDGPALALLEERHLSDIWMYMSEPGKLELLGQVVEIENVVWVLSGWKTSLEDRESTEHLRHSILHLTPTRDSRQEAVALDFIDASPFDRDDETIAPGTVRILRSGES